MTTRNSILNVLTLAIVAVATLVLATAPANAVDLLWDKNAAAAGQTDGSGTWLNPDQWWDAVALGNATWNNGTLDNAIIGNGGAGSTITLGAVTAGSVLFDSFTGTYTLSGGTLTQSGGIIVSPNAGTTTISSVIGGAGGITKTGAGMLTLSSTSSTYSGQLSIENGTIYSTSLNNAGSNGVLGNSALAVIMGASGQTGTLKIKKDGSVKSDKDFTLATGGTGEFWFDNLSNGPTNADRPLTLSGVIGGSGNFVKSGFAPISLSGNNNYSGTTTVSKGVLRLSSVNALPGGIGATGGTSALTINGVAPHGAAVELASGNFLRNLGPGIDQFQMPGGISGFSARGANRQVIVNNDPSFELVWGTATFNPSVLLLNYKTSANRTLTLQNKIDLGGATRTIAVNANTAYLPGDIRTSSGTVGLTKTGSGTLVLSGTNTYNGPTTISAGTLSVGAAEKLGSGGDLVFNGGILQITSATPMSLSGHTIVSNAGKTVTFNISGAGSLVIDQDNTYLGSTTISAGTLQLGDGGTNGTISAAPLLNNGTLIVNRSDTVTQGTAFPSIIGGSGSVTNAGAGELILNVANAYSGLTTASAGPITLSHALAIQNSALVTTGAGAVTLDTGITTPTFGGLSGATGDLGAGNVLATNYSSVTALTLNPQSGSTFTYGGVISNGSGAMPLTKTGAGAQILQGVNTYTGATTLSAGTLNLSGGGTILTTPGITLSGGKLTLTNATAGEAALDRVADAGPIISNGGTITYTNTSGANTYAETLGSVALTSGQLSIVESVNQAGAGSQTLTLAGLTRPGSTSSVTFSALTTAPNATKNMIVVTGGGTTTSGQIISPWATTGTTAAAQTDYAVYNADYVVPADIAASTEDTWATATDAYTLSGATALAGTRTITALRYSGTTGTLDLGANNLETFGILNGGTNTLTISGTGGVIRQQGTDAANLYITTGKKAITISSPIEDNTGALTLVKSGTGGTLTLSGTNNYSGGTVINGGTVNVKADANLGAADTAITFNASATLQNTQGGTVDLGARPITLNNGAVATFYLGRGRRFKTTGAVTGDGGVAIQVSGGNGPQLHLLSTNNTFTGPVDIRSGSDRPSVYVNSLADGPGAIILNNGGGHFIYDSGATGPLTLNNRQIVVQGGGAIDNASSYPMTINTDVLTDGTGNRTLSLSGTAAQGNQFNGDIGDGPGMVVGLTVDDWTLTGTNTYSGTTSIPNGKVTFLGTQAMPNSKIYMQRSTTLALLTDDAGTVNLGNEIEVNAIDSSSNIESKYTIHVGNNGGGTTGSTIVLGKVDFNGGGGNFSSTRSIRVTGDNGYRLQVGDVDMNVRSASTHTYSNQAFRPLSAPLTIAGTVKQINGNTGNTTANKLYLGGTAAGNLVSGTIANPDDYGTNPNARPLNVVKGESSEWTLSGSNTYTGVTTAKGGVLVLNSAGALPGGIAATGGTSALTFNGGGIGLGAGDFTRALAAAGTVDGVNFTGNGGWAAYNDDRVVNLGGASAQITWATANTGFNGKTLILGAATATNMVDLQNPLDLTTGIRTVQVDNGTADIDATLSGVISSTTTGGGLTKTGAGTLTLTNANTYTGTTTVSAGTLLVNNTTGSGTGTGAVNVNSGATLGGTGSITSTKIDIISGGTITPGASVDTLDVTGGELEMSAGSFYEWEIGAAGNDTIDITGGSLDLQAFELKILDLGLTSGIAEGAGLTVFTYENEVTSVNPIGAVAFTFDTTTLNEDLWGTYAPDDLTLVDDGAGKVQLFGLVGGVDRAQYWEEAASAGWDSAHWIPAGEVTPGTPVADGIMVVNSGVVTVATGTTATTADKLYIARNDPAGTVAVDGTLTTTRVVNIGLGGNMTVGGALTTATLNNDGAVDASGALNITTVNTSGTLTASGALNITDLNSSGTTDLTDSSGTVTTINVTGGTTTIASPTITQANVTAGVLEIEGGGVANLSVDGGTANVTAAASVADLTITDGVVNTQGNILTVTGGAANLGTMDIAVTNSGTFGLTGADLGDNDAARTLTLNGDTTTITGGGGGEVPTGFDAYYDFEDDTALGNDVSGNNYHLAHAGTVAQATGVADSMALDLTAQGGADGLKGNMGFYGAIITARTYAFWLDPDSLNDGSTLFKEGGGTNGVEIRIDEDGYVDFLCRDGGNSDDTLTSTTDVGSADGFTHVVAIYDNDAMSLYINGELEGSRDAGFPDDEITGHATTVGVGVDNGTVLSGNRGFDGLMDNFYVWSERGLTGPEVLQTYQAGLPGGDVLSNTTIAATATSTLVATPADGEPLAMAGIEVDDAVVLTINTPATDITLTNMTLGGGSMVKSTVAEAGGGDVTITLGGSGTLGGGDGVSSVGEFWGTGSWTNLTLAADSTYEQTFTFDGLSSELNGESLDMVEGNRIDLWGNLTLGDNVRIKLVDNGGSAVGEDVVLFRAAFGIVISTYSIELPDDWTSGGLLVDLPNGLLILQNLITGAGGPLPGDANNNGAVDDADWVIFKAQFGGAPGGANDDADFNDDGRVDLRDLAILKAAWDGGPGAPELPGPTATPEPATMSLLAIGGLLVLRRRRRKA